MNTTTLRTPSPTEIQAAAETMPFFDDLRVVVVREFDADTANALEGYVKSIPDSTALVFVRPGKPPLANPLYKAIAALDHAIITAPSHRDPMLMEKLSAVAGRVLGPAAQDIG